MTGSAPDNAVSRLVVQMQRLGVDWWLARLAMGVHLPAGGTTAPLLPVYARERVDFRDTLEMHLLMDLEERRIMINA